MQGKSLSKQDIMSRSRERLYWVITACLGALPFLAVILLAIFLFANGRAALPHMDLAEVTTGNWLPYEGSFGIMPLFVGTLATTAGAILLSIPLGLGVAYHLALFSGPRERRVGTAMVAVLAGLPSVVIGLWGMTWLVPRLGNSFTSATLVLAIMILPTFTLLAGASLRQVPRELLETTRSLGVPEHMVVWTAVRHASGGILSAAVLAAGRGLGEAVALSMVAGNVPHFPTLNGPVSTLTTTLIIEYGGSTSIHRAALFLLALLVVALIASTSIGARFARSGRSR